MRDDEIIPSAVLLNEHWAQHRRDFQGSFESILWCGNSLRFSVHFLYRRSVCGCIGYAHTGISALFLLPTLLFTQIHGELTPLFIQLPGVVNSQFLLADGLYVGQVIDAIIAKFTRFKDMDPSDLQLFKLDRSPVYPSQTLREAGVQAGTQLVVELLAASQAATSAGVCRSVAYGEAILQLRTCFFANCAVVQILQSPVAMSAPLP